MSDIIREFEAVAASAWANHEADAVLDAIEQALRSKYTRKYRGLVTLEIFYEEISAFRLPWSNNEIYVIPTKATIGMGSSLERLDHTDAFLVASAGVTLLESAEVEGGDDE